MHRTSTIRRCLIGGLAAAWLALALAPPTAAQEVSAEALFERGLADMEAGKYESGCPQLAESYRLDPLPGALFTLAECEAAWTKAATAIEHYQSFLHELTSLPPARRARFEERRRIALEKIAALNATAPELTVEVAAGAPPSLLVKRNGEPVDPAAYGAARKVDPGVYLFTAEVDGATLWERSVSLALSDRTQVQVPWPLAQPAAAPTVASGAKPAGKAHAPLRPWIYVSGAAGVAGLAVGAIAGGLALGKKNVIEEHCSDLRCDAKGHDAARSGQRAALASSVGFAVGLAGAAGAVTLLFLSRRSAERPTALRRELRPSVFSVRAGAGLGLEGSWR